MNIGIVCWWFNRGQATVGRYIRSIFDQLGHKTFVLARPTQDFFDLPEFIDTTGVWEQSGVTVASNFSIPINEYLLWVKKNSLETIFFIQNYQFKEIKKLRSLGIKTIGHFMWEAFEERYVRDAKKAFDIIYSLTKCEQARYARLGIESQWIPWGCHPELIEVHPRKKQDSIYFFYPGGYLSKRKPTRAVIEAFSRVSSPDIRLIIKAQTAKPKKFYEHIGENILDSKITVITEDLPTSKYYKLFASCHICLAPSRWEGLGLHLYEASAFGMPIITNDNPPMNETVRDRYNGLLVKSRQIGSALSGIASYEPDVDDLSRAITFLSDPSMLQKLSHNTCKIRETLSWDNTVKHFEKLLESGEIVSMRNHRLKYWLNKIFHNEFGWGKRFL